MDYDEVALYPDEFFKDAKAKQTENSIKLDCIDAAARIRKGEYKIKSKSGRSDVWNTFAAITNSAGEELEGFVLCMSCNKVYKFNKHWTSNLIKHTCYRAKKLKLDEAGDSDSGVSQVKRQKHKSSKKKRKDKPIDDKDVKQELNSPGKEDSFWKIHSELHKKLKNGVYKIRHKTGLRSDVWNIFGAIENESGEEVPEAVACKTCFKVYKFNRKWTTNLLKHDCYRAKKLNKSLNSSFRNIEKNQSFDDSSDEPFINFSAVKTELLIDEKNYEEQPFINPLTMDNGDSDNSAEEKEKWILSMSVLQKIQNGFYKMINKVESDSEIWQTFAAIENEQGEELADLIICKTCQLILKYDKSATSNLCQHKCVQTQQQRSNKNVKVSESTKQECEKLLMNWFINDCRHISLLQDVGFKNCAQFLLNLGANTPLQLQHLLPSINSLQTHVESNYAKAFTSLKVNIQKIKNLGYAITYDVHAEERINCSILVLTIHYISQAQLRSHLLAVKNIQLKYTAYDIQTNLAALLAEYDLELNERVICVSKNLHTIYYTRHHVLCINNLLQQCLEKLVVDWPELTYLIELSKNLLKGVKNTTERQFHAVYRDLLAMSENWHYLSAKIGKNERVNIFNLHNIQELVKLFKNFENSSRKLAIETNATMNLVFIHVHNLKKCCVEEAQDSDLLKKVKSLLSYALNNLIGTQLTMFHKIALFLFPPTSKLLQFSDEEKQQITNACKYFLMNLIPVDNKVQSEVIESQKQCNIYTDFVEPVKKLTPIESINSELVNYANQQTVILHDDFDVLKWWHLNKSQYPYLYKLSCAILAVPATNVTTDKILGKCLQLIHNNNNNNTTSSHNSQDCALINKILFLHVNKIC